MSHDNDATHFSIIMVVLLKSCRLPVGGSMLEGAPLKKKMGSNRLKVSLRKQPLAQDYALLLSFKCTGDRT